MLDQQTDCKYPTCKHSTAYVYGCRCPDCREANRQRSRKKQDKIKADIERNRRDRTCEFCLDSFRPVRSRGLSEIAICPPCYRGTHGRNRHHQVYNIRAHGVSWDTIRGLIRLGSFCYICRKPVPFDEVCVDHDHRCCPKEKGCPNCVRGFVHNRCNLRLGFLEVVRDELGFDQLLWLVESIRKGSNAG